MLTRDPRPRTQSTDSIWPWIFGSVAVVGTIFFLGESKYSPLA